MGLRPASVPPAVEFRIVSKTYSRKAVRTFLRHRLAWRRLAKSETFYALKDVSFSVGPGESLGLLGANGAGKSTLLSLVAGISFPDAGSISIQGNVAALLELGSGFHPDLSGAENLALNASLLGLSRKATFERFEEIVEFSGIGDFIHEPLRTYSTGMVMRLAFAVAVHVDPDILLIDEAFAVGDQQFQAKCFDRLFQFKRAGKSMVCASHAPGILKLLCDRGLWLDHGEVVLEGSIEEVIEAYQAGARGRAARI